jgi:hypothetical protein
MATYATLVVLSIALTLIMRLVTKRTWLTGLLAALGASLLFQVYVRIELGFLDPFFMIAFVSGFFIALAASLLLEFAIRVMRSQSRIP